MYMYITINVVIYKVLPDMFVGLFLFCLIHSFDISATINYYKNRMWNGRKHHEYCWIRIPSYSQTGKRISNPKKCSMKSHGFFWFSAVPRHPRFGEGPRGASGGFDTAGCGAGCGADAWDDTWLRDHPWWNSIIWIYIYINPLIIHEYTWLVVSTFFMFP